MACRHYLAAVNATMLGDLDVPAGKQNLYGRTVDIMDGANRDAHATSIKLFRRSSTSSLQAG